MTDAAPDDAGTRRLGALAIALAVGSFVFAVYAVHGSMAPNPIELPLESKIQTISWVPEGWAFFTRDPEEEVLRPYVRDGDGWKVAVPTGSSARYAFGWNRAGRGVWTELGLLIEGAPPSLYKSCENEEPAKCFEKRGAPIHVKNKSPVPYICGDVILNFQKPPPWAWARDGHPPVMASRFLFLNVEC